MFAIANELSADPTRRHFTHVTVATLQRPLRWAVGDAPGRVKLKDHIGHGTIREKLFRPVQVQGTKARAGVTSRGVPGLGRISAVPATVPCRGARLGQCDICYP